MTHEERLRFAEILKQPDGTVIQEYKGGSWQTMKIEQCDWERPFGHYRLPPNYPREIWVNVYPNQTFGTVHLYERSCEFGRGTGERISSVKYVLAE